MNSVFGHTNPFWPALGRIQHREELRALDVLPDTGKSRTMVQVRGELVRLTEAGLSCSTAEYLEERLGERDVSSVPQHGDFWPRNLVRSGDGWRILDLETCGSIDLPLYDVFHLLRGSVWDAGGKGTGVWLEWWSACQHRLPALRHLVAAQLRDDDSMGGEIALAAYAASFPLRLLRRGISLERVRPWVRELEELPAILEEKVLEKILEASL
jgi:glutathione S-transferase